MSMLRLIYGHLRRILFQPKLVVVLILVPVAIVFSNYLASSSHYGKNMGLVENRYSEEIKKNLGELALLFPNKQEGMKALEDLKIKSLYEINEEGILRYSYEESDTLRSMDKYFQEKIREKEIQLAFEKKGLHFPGADSLELRLMVKKEEALDYAYIFTVSLMFYAIMLYSSTMAQDLYAMQKSGVLERSVASPQHFMMLNLSYTLANSVLLLISYSVIFIGAQKLIGFEIKSLPTLLLSTLLASFFSITLAQTAVRFLKTEGAVSTTTLLIGIVGFISGTFSYIDIVKIPGFLKVVGRIHPQYYLLDMIFTGRILTNTLVIGLMILVILTAGSYKLERFARR